MNQAMRELRKAVYKETLSTIEVIKLIIKLEKTGGVLRNGYHSTYDYLTKGLKYSEGSATRRIRAARVVAQKPETMEMLRKREVSLCTLSLIQGKVKEAPELIEQIKGKSKREVESLQELMPVKASLRETITPVKVITPPMSSDLSAVALAKAEASAKGEPVLPAESGKQISSTPFSKSPPPLEIKATVEQRLKLAFTVSSESQKMIDQAKTLLSSRFPTGATLEDLFNEGVKLIIQDMEKKRAKLGSRKSKRSTSDARYIPAEIKKSVLERDSYRCCYRHQDGSICGSTWDLEIDHITPFALNGKNTPENLRVYCRNHNQLAAEDSRLLKRAC